MPWKSHNHSTKSTTRKHIYMFLILLYPTFIQYNWGLQRYALELLFLLKNIDCGYSLKPPRQGGSYKYLQSMFWPEIWKISESFIWKISFSVVKFSVYLNRRVFVMTNDTKRKRKSEELQTMADSIHATNQRKVNYQSPPPAGLSN